MKKIFLCFMLLFVMNIMSMGVPKNFKLGVYENVNNSYNSGTYYISREKWQNETSEFDGVIIVYEGYTIPCYTNEKEILHIVYLLDNAIPFESYASFLSIDGIPKDIIDEPQGFRFTKNALIPEGSESIYQFKRNLTDKDKEKMNEIISKTGIN